MLLNHKNDKLAKSERDLVYVTYFSNFGISNISGAVKVQTSNFARGLKVRDKIQHKKRKTGQNES